MASAAVAAVFFAAVGRAAITHTQLTGVGCVGLMGLVFLGTRAARPKVVLWGALLAFAFVPVYWIPFAFHLFPYPGVLLMLLLAVASLRQVRRGAGRVTAVDCAVVAFAGFTAAGVLLHVRTTNDWTTIVLQWLVPYAGARIALAGGISAATFMSAWALIGVATLPFAFVEVTTNSNIFAKLTVNAGYANTWASEQFRLGRARAEVAFGHSICYSMFITTASLFALAMALRARRSNERVFWIVAAGGLLAGQFVTQARTGWVMLLVGLVSAFVVVLRRRVDFSVQERLVGLAAVAVAAVGGLAALDPSTIDRLTSIFSPDPTSEVASSSAAREGLFSTARAAWAPFGNTTSAFTEAGVASVDNSYLLLIDRWGYLATAMIVVAAIVLIWDIAFLPVTAWTVVSVAALANLVAWIFVAPITQQQNLVWLLVGAASAGIAMRQRAAT